MSAPVTERTRTATRPRPATIPAQRAAPAAARERTARPSPSRREELFQRLAAGRGARTATAGRAQFVMLVMVLLAAGLVATLWLSTAATADSYRLQEARTAAAGLAAQSERLHREVTTMGSAPALAQRAAQLGMVPVQDPARLVVAPDGTVTVVGEPEAATAPAPVVAPAAPVVPGATAPVEPVAPQTGTVTDPDAAPGGGAPVSAQPGDAAPATGTG